MSDWKNGAEIYTLRGRVDELEKELKKYHDALDEILKIMRENQSYIQSHGKLLTSNKGWLNMAMISTNTGYYEHRGNPQFDPYTTIMRKIEIENQGFTEILNEIKEEQKKQRDEFERKIERFEAFIDGLKARVS